MVQTAIAAKFSCEEFGDVFVLDDSTDEKIRKKLDKYAEEYEFNIFRRSERRDYKAGAVNDWLEKYGDDYDFLMILDADQRPLPGIFQYVLPGFKDPSVAFIQVPQYYSNLSTLSGTGGTSATSSVSQGYNEG